MTKIKGLRCAWCHQDLELAPDDVIVTVANQRSVKGVYQWSHCGQVHTKAANHRILELLKSSGCRIDRTDDFQMLALCYELDEVHTLADMGWVS